MTEYCYYSGMHCELVNVPYDPALGSMLAVDLHSLCFRPSLQVTCIMGDPIVPPKWVKGQGKKGERIPEALVDQLHAQFLADMTALFDKYKAAAGYPNAVLEVV